MGDIICNGRNNKSKTKMKTLILLSLLAAVSAQADMVKSYFKSNGTLVQGYDRTPANDTVTDNRSYRGYPSQQPGYVAPFSAPRPVPMPSPSFAPAVRPYAPATLPKW